MDFDVVDFDCLTDLQNEILGAVQNRKAPSVQQAATADIIHDQSQEIMDTYPNPFTSAVNLARTALQCSLVSYLTSGRPMDTLTLPFCVDKSITYIKERIPHLKEGTDIKFSDEDVLMIHKCFCKALGESVDVVTQYRYASSREPKSLNIRNENQQQLEEEANVLLSRYVSGQCDSSVTTIDTLHKLASRLPLNQDDIFVSRARYLLKRMEIGAPFRVDPELEKASTRIMEIAELFEAQCLPSARNLDNLICSMEPCCSQRARCIALSREMWSLCDLKKQ